MRPQPTPRTRSMGRLPVMVLALLLAATGADALNELRLDGPSGGVGVGDPVDVTLSIAFTDVTLGGAVAVSYDAALLELLSVSFDPALPDDPDFRCPSAGLPTSVGCPSSPTFVSFGSLAGLPTGGPLAVATLHFLALAPGTGDVRPGVANAFSDTVGSPLGVSLVGARVAVPEPAAGLLALATGASLLLAARRRARR